MVKHKGSASPGFLLSLPRRDRFVILGALLVAALLLVGLAFWSPTQATPAAEASDPTPSAVAEPAPVVVAQPPSPSSPSPSPSPSPEVDRDVAPAPGMVPELAPPDGPDPDVGPYQIDPIAIRGELETHGVTTTDEQLPKLTEAVNGYLARSDAADLKAWDQQITDDVKSLWPGLDRDHRIDVVRCTAEYVERVHARNAGLKAPPDSDDHDVTVSGRGPQPRVSGGN